MTVESDMLTKSIAVPAWVVYICASIGVAMCATIGGIIVQDRSQIHTLSNAVAEVRQSNVKLAEVAENLAVVVTDLRTEVRLLNQQRGM